jgi:hypothetical protein
VKRAVALAAPFAVALVVFTAWLWWTPEVFTGDEPHYLVTADSIVHHRTLDLRASYADPGGVREYLPTLVADHGIDARGDGRLVPVPQGLGLPIVIAPVWALFGSLLATRLWMVVLAALFAQQLFGLLTDVVPGRKAIVWAVWCAAVLTLPVLGFSNQLYPEVPAALLLTVALRALLRVRDSTGAAWVAGVALALLPWFHARYTVFSVVLGAAAVVVIARARPVRATLPIVLPLAMSAAALLGTFAALYGEWLPTRVYDLVPHPAHQSRAAVAYRMVVGSLLSPTDGLAVFAPVFLIGVVAIVAAARARAWAAVATGAAAAYLLLVVPLVPQGRFGSDVPARFVIVLVPVFALCGALVLARHHWLIVPGAALLAISAVVVVAVGRNYERVFVEPETIGLVASAAPYLPWTSDASGADRHAFSAREQIAGVRGHAARVERHGVIASWQPLRLREARYRAELPVTATGGVVRADAVVGESVVASRTVPATAGAVVFSFAVPRDDAIVRLDLVAAQPVEDVRVGEPRLERVSRAPARNARVRAQVPEAIGWAVALCALAAVLAAGRPAREATT